MNRSVSHTALVRDVRLALGRETDLTLWAMQPGGMPDPSGRPIRSGPVGIADLIGILERRVHCCGFGPECHPLVVGVWFCLEVKTGDAKQRPGQVLWGNLIRKRGGFYAVVRSVADAQAAYHRARLGMQS